MTGSSIQSRSFIEEIYGDRFSPSQMAKSLVRTVNTWYTIYVMIKMTKELISRWVDDETADIDDKILAILSPTIQCFAQIDKSSPYKLLEHAYVWFRFLKNRKATLYNSNGAIEPIFQ